MTEKSLGTDSQVGRQRVPMSARTVAGWLWPFSIGGVALFSISALFYFHFHRTELRPDGLLQQAIATLYSTFGWAPSVVFFLLVFAWSLIWFVTGVLERPVSRVARLVVLAVMLGVFLNLGNGGVVAEPHKGAFGAWLAGRLVSAVGYVPSLVVVWLTTFASLLLATDWFFSEWFERPRAEAEEESGVEEAVADQLRAIGPDASSEQQDQQELGGDDATEASSAASSTANAAPAPHEAEEHLSRIEGVEDEGVPREPGVVADLTTRRERYAERRRLRSERAAASESTPSATPEPAAPAPAVDAEADDAPSVDEKALSEQELAALFDAPSSSDVGPDSKDDSAVVLAPEYVEADEVALSDDDALAPAGPAEDEASEEVFAEIAVDEGFDEVEDDSDREEPEADGDGYGEEEADEDEDEYEYEDEDEYEEEDYEGEADEAEADEVEECEGDGDEVGSDEALEAEDATDEFEVSLDDQQPHEVADIDEEVVLEESSDSVEDAADEDAADEDHSDPECVEVDSAVAPSEGAAVDAAAISIPRPDNAAEPRVPTPPAVPAERDPGRQQNLFGSGLDEQLIEEARELLVRGRRPSASLLQRKLRIDYELAQDLLRELSNRGLMGTDS